MRPLPTFQAVAHTLRRDARQMPGSGWDRTPAANRTLRKSSARAECGCHRGCGGANATRRPPAFVGPFDRSSRAPSPSTETRPQRASRSPRGTTRSRRAGFPPDARCRRCPPARRPSGAIASSDRLRPEYPTHAGTNPGRAASRWREVRANDETGTGFPVQSALRTRQETGSRHFRVLRLLRLELRRGAHTMPVAANKPGAAETNRPQRFSWTG